MREIVDIQSVRCRCEKRQECQRMDFRPVQAGKPPEPHPCGFFTLSGLSFCPQSDFAGTAAKDARTAGQSQVPGRDNRGTVNKLTASFWHWSTAVCCAGIPLKASRWLRGEPRDTKSSERTPIDALRSSTGKQRVYHLQPALNP